MLTKRHVSHFNHTYCVSSIEHIAKCLDSYTVMQSILASSHSDNFTQSAFSAVNSNYTESLKAILEKGKVDVSSQFETFDLIQPSYDHMRDRYVEKDTFTLLHLAISLNNSIAVELILSYNISSVNYKTRSGMSVLQRAILQNNVHLFHLFSRYVSFDKYMLHLVVYFDAYNILTYILKHGEKDICIACRSGDITLENVRFHRYNKTLEFKTLIRQTAF